MLRENEAYWMCLNRECGNTAPCDEAEREQESHVCGCGSMMRRGTRAAVYSYLNFLREAPSSETEEKKEEERMPCETGMWSMKPRGERLRWS